MRWKTGVLIAACLMIPALKGFGIFSFPEMEKVPIGRLFSNLGQRLAKNTNDFELTYALARLHAMAYATKLNEIVTIKTNGIPMLNRYNRGVPESVEVRTNGAERIEAAQHLTNAIALFERSIILLKRS